jgi:hypothetical protein
VGTGLGVQLASDQRKGLVSDCRSLGVVLTGHDRAAQCSHMILSSATYQQVGYQPLQGAPCPRFDQAAGSAVKVLSQSVDTAIRHLKSATPHSCALEHPPVPPLLCDAQAAAASLRELHCGQRQFPFDWDGVLDDLWVAWDAVPATNTVAALKALTPLRARLPRR